MRPRGGTPLEPPRPRGVPNPSFFRIGAIGHFLAAGLALPFSFFVLVFGLGPFVGSFSAEVCGIASLMSVALALHLVGYYGLSRNYGPRIGMVTFRIGIVATILMLAVTGLRVLSPRSTLDVQVAFADALLGLVFMLGGWTFIANRHYLLRGLAIAAGILFIIAGALVGTIILAPAGVLVAMPAFLLGGIVLLSAAIPAPDAPSHGDSDAETRPRNPLPP